MRADGTTTQHLTAQFFMQVSAQSAASMLLAWNTGQNGSIGKMMLRCEEPHRRQNIIPFARFQDVEIEGAKCFTNLASLYLTAGFRKQVLQGNAKFRW